MAERTARAMPTREQLHIWQSHIGTAEALRFRLEADGVIAGYRAVADFERAVVAFGEVVEARKVFGTYRVMEALTSQADVTVLEVKDYIANPKPNGYKSLHVIAEIPLFLPTGPGRHPHNETHAPVRDESSHPGRTRRRRGRHLLRRDRRHRRPAARRRGRRHPRR